MKSRIAAGALLATAFGFGAGMFYSRHTTGGTTGAASGARQILYYHDPMHPEYRSAEPGIAPDCGMQLEPVYASSGSSEVRPVAHAPLIDAEAGKVQALGIVAEEARTAPFTHTVRTVGRVQADETRVYRMVAGSDGWVRKISSTATNTFVKKGELLAIYYGRDFQAAQQSYIYALKNFEANQKSPATQNPTAAGAVAAAAQAQIDAAIDNLQALGVSDSQIQQIAATRETTRNIELRAPISGFVTATSLYTGQRFERGSELMRIADLTSVWITADLYGSENLHISPGSRARILVPNAPQPLSARVTDTLPQFDANSRTTRVRLELNNPGFSLRDGMFVDVEFPLDLPPSLHIPVDAVLNSGTRSSVFVERSSGKYEPRTVDTGWQFGGRVQILNGLTPGERVVRSGAFLLDSETRMKRHSPAPAGSEPETASGPAVKDPVCGMSITARKYTAVHAGKTLVFCSRSCKDKFESDRGKYAAASGAS